MPEVDFQCGASRTREDKNLVARAEDWRWSSSIRDRFSHGLMHVVGRVGQEPVQARVAVKRVDRAVVEDRRGVESIAAVQAAGDAAVQVGDSSRAVEVGARRFRHECVERSQVDGLGDFIGVVHRAADEDVFGVVAVDEIGARTADQQVASIAAVERIIAAAAENDVETIAAGKDVVGRVADEGVVADAARDCSATIRTSPASNAATNIASAATNSRSRSMALGRSRSFRPIVPTAGFAIPFLFRERVAFQINYVIKPNSASCAADRAGETTIPTPTPSPSVRSIPDRRTAGRESRCGGGRPTLSGTENRSLFKRT